MSKSHACLFLVLRRFMCRGHAQWPRTGKSAPKLRPRKTGDTSLTSPVMCPGVISFLTSLPLMPMICIQTWASGKLQNACNQHIRKSVPIRPAPTFSPVFSRQGVTCRTASNSCINIYFFPLERRKGDLSYRPMQSFMIKPSY